MNWNKQIFWRLMQNLSKILFITIWETRQICHIISYNGFYNCLFPCGSYRRTQCYYLTQSVSFLASSTDGWQEWVGCCREWACILGIVWKISDGTTPVSMNQAQRAWRGNSPSLLISSVSFSHCLQHSFIDTAVRVHLQARVLIPYCRQSRLLKYLFHFPSHCSFFPLAWGSFHRASVSWASVCTVLWEQRWCAFESGSWSLIQNCLLLPWLCVRDSSSTWRGVLESISNLSYVCDDIVLMLVLAHFQLDESIEIWSILVLSLSFKPGFKQNPGPNLIISVSYLTTELQ